MNRESQQKVITRWKKNFEPKALTKLGMDKNHWTLRVMGIGSSYRRVVGELEKHSKSVRTESIAVQRLRIAEGQINASNVCAGIRIASRVLNHAESRLRCAATRI
jgi:hypothetical protein